ncbi:MAG: hypothetical protein P8099_04845 [Gemmatimonadota bacterium]|jgi:hypothetical protein
MVFRSCGNTSLHSPLPAALAIIGCAAILVWSRPLGAGEGHPYNRVMMAAGLGLFALLTPAFR